MSESNTNAVRHKEAAARHAAGLVTGGTIVGLGTGTTAEIVVRELAQRQADGLRFTGVPTSRVTEAQARGLGIPLLDFNDVDQIDLTIDGADEIDLATFALIKGRGGALLREKLVAAVTAREVIVADTSKVVARLGERCPVPVEVVPFGWRHARRRLEQLGATVTPRQAAGQQDLYTTDSGNLILDCAFGPIADPPALAARLKALPGVVEHGLFIDLAHTLVLAGLAGVQVHQRGERASGGNR